MDHQGPETRGFGSQTVRVLAILCVVLGLYYLPTGYFNYIVAVRTPTTVATIDHCDNPTTCYGSWSVRGVSKSGRIYGDLHGDHPVGSRVDVYVWRGDAHEGRPSKTPAILMMSGSLIALMTGVVLWWSRRRRNKRR
jgi:hypothetical protein